jgi:hypothetical protein
MSSNQPEQDKVTQAQEDRQARVEHTFSLLQQESIGESRGDLNWQEPFESKYDTSGSNFTPIHVEAGSDIHKHMQAIGLGDADTKNYTAFDVEQALTQRDEEALTQSDLREINEHGNALWDYIDSDQNKEALTQEEVESALAQKDEFEEPKLKWDEREQCLQDLGFDSETNDPSFDEVYQKACDILQSDASSEDKQKCHNAMSKLTGNDEACKSQLEKVENGEQDATLSEDEKYHMHRKFDQERSTALISKSEDTPLNGNYQKPSAPGGNNMTIGSPSPQQAGDNPELSNASSRGINAMLNLINSNRPSKRQRAQYRGSQGSSASPGKPDPIVKQQETLEAQKEESEQISKEAEKIHDEYTKQEGPQFDPKSGEKPEDFIKREETYNDAVEQMETIKENTSSEKREERVSKLQEEISKSDTASNDSVDNEIQARQRMNLANQAALAGAQRNADRQITIVDRIENNTTNNADAAGNKRLDDNLTRPSNRPDGGGGGAHFGDSKHEIQQQKEAAHEAIQNPPEDHSFHPGEAAAAAAGFSQEQMQQHAQVQEELHQKFSEKFKEKSQQEQEEEEYDYSSNNSFSPNS